MFTEFTNPSAVYRPAPLWVWNDEMTADEIIRQLEEMKSQGFGGAFVHPRPGLITEYLSEEWFARWADALAAAKALDMKLYIYDENSYPSGFAGGHVPAQLPDCLAHSVSARIVETGQTGLRLNRLVKAFLCEGPMNALIIGKDITDIPVSQWHEHGATVAVFEIVEPKLTTWTAGFSFVDLLRPEATQAFLACTHEEYSRRFGADFGSHIPALFTDEPMITGSSVYDNEILALPFSYWFASAFQEMNGYSLLKNLPGVFYDAKSGRFDFPATKIRYDYYNTIRLLWTKNAVKPISAWCEKHGIAWTGHYMEHQWPLASAGCLSPAVMSNYEYHRWPGIDMLRTHMLKHEDSDSLLYTILELRSVANQFGKARTLCEAFGAGGTDSGIADFRRIGDWLLVNGVNFLNHHLSYSTSVGVRKYDHPQSFDSRQPWWPEMGALNDYQARICAMLSQGEMKQRILVLNPTTTGYLVARKDERGTLEDGALNADANPNMHAHLDMVFTMAANQWDFDLGDEYILARHAKVVGASLQLKKQMYDVIVVSGDMKNMMRQTVALLDVFQAHGGNLLFVGRPGVYVDGLADEAAYARLSAGAALLADTHALMEKLDSLLPKAIIATTPWPRGIGHMRRILEDGRSVYFFTNHSNSRYKAEITVEGESAEIWDLWTGETHAAAFTAQCGKVCFPLSLARCDSAMVVVSPGAAVPAAEQKLSLSSEHALTRLAVSVLNDNSMPLDYCDLHVDGETLHGLSVHRAGTVLYRRRGFEANPWDNAVQFKNVIMDKKNFGVNSGFSVTYRFMAGAVIPTRVLAVVERAVAYRIEANGTAVDWLDGEHPLDIHNGVADITHCLQEGENTVTITASAFDVRLEIAPLLLQGDFAVEAINGKWTLLPKAACNPGQSGYPFYMGRIRYEYAITLDRQSIEKAALSLPEWAAAAIAVDVNGQSAGIAGVDQGNEKDITAFLTEGENRIDITLASASKNLFGPHHDPQKPRNTAWPGMWKNAPAQKQPSAGQYDLMAFGLYGDPSLKIYRNEIVRCFGDTPLYTDYHDKEWGRPEHDDIKLFELLILEGAQAGLSWITVLKKREAYRKAFDGFDPEKVALYDDEKIEELMANEGIIRNRLKINAAIINAKLFLEIVKEHGSFDQFIWGYVNHTPIMGFHEKTEDIPITTPISDKISKDLKKMGFKFVGSTIIYSFMQAAGMVNDHLKSCLVFDEGMN